MGYNHLVLTAVVVGTLVLIDNGAVKAQSQTLVATAWAPVDRTAERIFRQADADDSGFLTPDQFKAVEPKLNKSIVELARRGALRGLPPNALNAQSYGVMLPGAKEISRPEFVLEARSRASRLLGRMPPFAGMPGPGMPGLGTNAGRPHRKQHSNRGNNGPPQPRDTAAINIGGNSV